MSKTPRMGFTAKLKNSKKSGTVNRAKGFALRNEAKQAMIESVDNSQPFQFSPFGLPQLFNPDGGQELSQWDTLFDNLRFYLISNNRQLISQCIAELGLVRTICDVPVSDALRGGIVIKSKELDEDDIKKLQRFMLFNKDLQTIGRAMSKMRGFGGAGVVLICDDQNPESKLDVSKLTMKSNVKFKAADLWELFWDVQDTGMYDPSIAIENVKTYRYYGKNVDASRVTPLIGIEAPSFIRPRLRGWGLSELEILIRGINQFLKSNNLAFEVLDEFKVDVYKIKNLINSLMTVTGQNNVRQRVALANQIKNFQGALVMDSEDDYDHKQLSFAGIAEMMVQFRIQIASDMRIPITKLFGISATGFNSGEDDIEVYNGMVESEIRGKMLVPTTFVTSIRCQQLFGFVPDDLEIEFKPLRMLSAEQEETVKTAQFGRLLAAADSNRISTAQFLEACNSANLLVKPIDLTDEQLSMDSLDKPEPAVDPEGNPDADKDKKPPKVAIKKAASTAKAPPEAKNSMPKIVRVVKPGDPDYLIFNDTIETDFENFQGPRIVTVGIIADDELLTGKRRDNGLWTSPGGHMDEGETPEIAACREVLEESGIEISPEDLQKIAVEKIVSHRTGKEFMICAYIAHVDKEKATVKNDPDQEISIWKWVHIDEQTPELKAEARHAKNDAILNHLFGIKNSITNPGKVDEGLWAKAKKAAEKSGARSWALVTFLYKRMGGKFE